MTVTRGYKQLIEEAEALIETLPPGEAKSRVDTGDALIVDIRDVRELDREGVIPGSVHAPRGMLEFWVDPESPYHRELFDTEKTLVLHCASGWRSALATRSLLEMGLDNVAHIGGGLTAWRDAGLPIEQREKKNEK